MIARFINLCWSWLMESRLAFWIFVPLIGATIGAVFLLLLAGCGETVSGIKAIAESPAAQYKAEATTWKAKAEALGKQNQDLTTVAGRAKARADSLDQVVNDEKSSLARAELEAATAHREVTRLAIEATVQPVRYVLMAGSVLGGIAMLAGIALWVASLLWSFGFGGKFGLGIAGAGAAVAAGCVVLLGVIAVAVAHFIAICVVLGIVVAIAAAIAVWSLHRSHRVSVAQTIFSDAAASKLKELEYLATNPNGHTAEELLRHLRDAALAGWPNVRGPAVAQQVKAGVQGRIDRLRARIQAKVKGA